MQQLDLIVAFFTDSLEYRDQSLIESLFSLLNVTGCMDECGLQAYVVLLDR